MNYENKTITIIDTFGFLFRSYYALPPLKSKDGFPTGLLTGFMNFVANIGKDFQTDYLVFALDSKGKTFRNDIYSEYKANRSEVPEDLLAQLPIAIAWIEEMGFKTAIRSGFEADDIIASLAHDAKKKGLRVRVVSHDKDLYQLIEDDKVFLFDPIKKQVLNEAHCMEKYGVLPSQFTNYQSLLGDSADNVPGVKGVGAKTAQALIEKFDNLDNIYENLQNIEKPRWIKLLSENKELAYISKDLVTLRTNCHVIDNIEEFNLPEENPILKIEDTLISYGLEKIIKRVHQYGLNYKTHIPKDSTSDINIIPELKVEVSKLSYETILLSNKEELFEIIKTIPKDALLAFDTETTNIDVKKAKIVGFSFCFDKQKAYYVPINHSYLGVPSQIHKTDALEAIKLLDKHKLIFQNFKYDYDVIRFNFSYKLTVYADTMILSWLLNPGSKIALDYVSMLYFKHKMIAFKDVVKKGEDFSSIDLEKACEYAAEDAYITRELYFKLEEEFKEQNCENLLSLAFKYEFDFIYIISAMQEYGIKVDVNLLQELKEKNAKYLKELTSKIHELSSSVFNINSPKQLGEILFDKLGIKPPKKTKTGYSTNEAVLQKIYKEHEVVPKILDYREAFKLQSTYIEPLLTLALENSENKIHTSFLQTGTATGRLSSKNPNLQNIPVKSEAGKEIRRAFIAKEGYSLVGVDYSQIELRLLAHFSKDEALVKAFNEGLDIHTQTAVKIFGQDLALEKRNVAKSINFGLLYGMGSRKLGETLGIPSKEAKVYIESYFEAFSTVKSYLKSIEDDVLQDGYVTTLIGRRRIFDFDLAPAMLRASYLREAVNTRFQGSAADLIKLSMIEIHDKYKDDINITMPLQIHDELIFEIKNEFLEKITKDIKNIMEKIYPLNVPLLVSVNVGNNWAELK